MTLKAAVIRTREAEVIAVDSFIALYSVLGEVELYDDIASAMEDNNMSETIISYKDDEYDPIDDIIRESGE